MKLWQGLFFLFFVLLAVGIEASPADQQCQTNPAFKDKNKFETFFDKCFIDNTKVNVLGQIAIQLQTWFNEETYPVYILVSLLVLLFCVVKEIKGNDEMARYNYIRLQGMLLMMRMGLAISITPWMWAAIHQERPCYCSTNGGVLAPLNGVRWWGMPSGLTFSSTLIASHIMATLKFIIWVCLLLSISIPFGILWIIIMAGASIASGQFSFGQTIVGITLGLVLHFYSIRTPLYMRIVDFFASLIAGFIAIALAMKNFPHFDFSFSIMFLVGLAWQVYAFTLQFVSFEWGFMKRAITLPLQALHDVDFMYFRPLNSHTSDSEPPSFKAESYWTVFLTVTLFIILCGLRVLAPQLDDFTVNY